MNATRKPTSRRWSWKRTVALIVFAVLAAAAVLVAVPALVPEAVLRREVEAALSAQLGRPVTIDGATFRWSRGLRATGVRVGRSGEEGETPLATIRLLTVQFDPLDAAPSLAGAELPLESVRLEGLELWLVLDREGRANVQDLAERKPLEVHSIQVTDARVHVENRRLGQSVTVENLSASVGQLAGSGHGYVSVSAELAGERPGRFVVTANMDRLEFGGEKPPIASLKADWTDLAWPALCAMITDDADLAARLGRTSGHMTVNFDRGGWSAEGAVEAAGLTIGPCGPLGRATIPEAILGFQVRQKAAEAPLEILLARFSAPGIDLRAFRRTSKSDEPPPHLHLAKAPDGRWALKEADLHATGTVTWVPLCQSIPALGDLAKPFEQMGGKARVVLDVEPAGGGHAVTASADLTDTLMIREGTVHKDEHQTLRLKVKAACAGDFGSVRVSAAELVTETARFSVEGDLPLPMPAAAAPAAGTAAALEASPSPAAPASADGPAAWLAGARFSAVAHVESVETLLEMVPALQAPLGSVVATGPLAWELYCSPSGAADLPAGSPPTWDVKVRGDLTKTRVAAPDGVRKEADRPATFALQARVAPGARRVEVGRAAVTLDRGTVEWNGSARVEWPSEEGARPAGRFDGTLAVTRVESLGAVVSPASFAKAAPVSGNVRFDVLADLADGRLRTRLKTSLADLGIDAADWFAKPAGRPASLTLDALWQSGAQDHVEASAEVELPGARLTALGQSEVQVRFVDLAGSAPEADAAAPPAAPPPEAAPADGDAPADADAASPPKRGAIHVQLVPTSTLELRAAVSDLARAAEVSPALARHLKRWGAAGSADATVLLAMGRRAIEATASVDLTAAAIDCSPYLRKPAGQAMRLDLAADAPPPTGQSLRLHLAKVEARLADSVARAEDGWARLSLRGLTSGLSGTALLTAVLEEADVRVRADVNHDAALGAALPWLEPLYARCRLDGPTKLTLAYSGTPLRGRVQLDADATACRISPGRPADAGAGTVAPGAAAAGGAAGETVIKAAGTPATVRLELRYGEVPGEMVVDRLSTTLADATAETHGRMLFDDPRLTVLAPPTAWSFEVHGRMPDAAVLASLLPARLADLKPTGGVTLDLVAAADPKAAQLESCQLRFDKAGITWLGKPIQLDGPVTYDHHRLATDGLRLVAGGSDVNLVAYIADPKRDPTGSVFITGPRLDIKESLALVQETSAYVASLAGGAGGKTGSAGRALSEVVALRARQLLAGARLSVEVNLDCVTLAVPQWNTTYDLLGLQAEGRLAERRFVMPRFGCSLNEGTIGGEMVLDFRGDVPLLSYAYDAADLHIKDNLIPFIDATFPGMKAFGTLSTRARMTQPLAAGSLPVGGGETILTDGVLEGPGAPEYMQVVLPGLRLTKYPFNRMSNTSESKPNGDVVNHMLFDGKAYDIYIFGVTHPDGYTDYTLGVDLSVSLGEKVVSLPLEQGKLPLMRYTGRIVGNQFAERQISYVLPHEFAYDVFIRKNLLLRVIRGLGEKEPEIKRPLVAPPEKDRTRREG